MKQTENYAVGDIDKAVDALIELRPAYAQILNFYRQIFIAQEKQSQDIVLRPIQIPEHVIAVKMREGFPLIDMSEFALDHEKAVRLLEQLCRIAHNANEALSTAAGSISGALQNGLIQSDLLHQSLLHGKDEYFERVAVELKIEKKVCIFFTYNSVKPSLAVCAKQLLRHLPSPEDWKKSICPVCGNSPGLASIEGQGERFLFCSFCWTKWRVQRLICAFCEKEGQASGQYFYSQEESEYRVDTCEHCKKYLKTVDIRQIGRTFYPPLEQVATLHLDMKAAELGYQNPMHLYHL